MYQRFLTWLLREENPEHHAVHYPWWQVMCLTGVDYFSTLGYQPGIAAIAAGNLAPVATLILILLTLFGALPIYKRVASYSPHGEGSISMLEKLLSWWQGKLFVLCLLGFVATDFIITMTLSAADATAHIIENPLTHWLAQDHRIGITLLLLTGLGYIFLRGFHEAIGIAVVLVLIYLSLNAITITVAFFHVFQHLELIYHWQQNIQVSHSNPLMILAIACLLFPKLALGLSGFETGVAVMPLVQGDRQDPGEKLQGRILNTHKLLQTAAIIMSVFLLSSSLVTIWLIPPEAFQRGGEANGRALAYLAHQYLGNGFGTVYDLSTISILWFAGASAMAGLLNIVPRYLPRYGMAPDWARKTRPLVLIYTAIAFGVTILFRADVDAQGGAYATGVLVLMSSAAFAVTLSVQKLGRRSLWLYGLITLVFFYTTLINILERPDGVKIAAFFIGAIMVSSLISRVWRSTEIRADHIHFDPLALAFLDMPRSSFRIIAHRRFTGDEVEYIQKEKSTREDHNIAESEPIIFLEIEIADASEFREIIEVQGVQIGDYQILRAKSSAVPNAIAALLLEIRDRTGILPHAYFGWPEGNPVVYLIRFLMFGEGDIAVVTREVLRRNEKDYHNRPVIHVGG